MPFKEYLRHPQEVAWDLTQEKLGKSNKAKRFFQEIIEPYSRKIARRSIGLIAVATVLTPIAVKVDAVTHAINGAIDGIEAVLPVHLPKPPERDATTDNLSFCILSAVAIDFYQRGRGYDHIEEMLEKQANAKQEN